MGHGAGTPGGGPYRAHSALWQWAESVSLGWEGRHSGRPSTGQHPTERRRTGSMGWPGAFHRLMCMRRAVLHVAENAWSRRGDARGLSL